MILGLSSSFGKDKYCQQFGVSIVFSPVRVLGGDPSIPLCFKQEALYCHFHRHWILDYLDGTQKAPNGIYQYHSGIPYGYRNSADHDYYVYNHLNFKIRYTNVSNEEDGPTTDSYRIVHYAIGQLSIYHYINMTKLDSKYGRSHGWSEMKPEEWDTHEKEQNRLRQEHRQEET